MLQKFLVIIVTVLMSACASKSETNTKPEVIKCPEQRPQICTREYIPVCASRDTGIRCITAPCPSSEEKTYGNGCAACADEKVSEYRLGACGQEADKN